MDERIRRLERRQPRPVPSWEEAQAAEARTYRRSLASALARIEGHDLPAADDQARADAALLRRWHEAYPSPPTSDVEQMRAKLLRRFGVPLEEPGGGG